MEELRGIEDYDTIFFVPHFEKPNQEQVKIEVAKYVDKGEKLNGTEMGDMYDIILFRLNEECDITDLDRFEGILLDPRVYISRMIGDDWYGMVTKKTTTSKPFSDRVFDGWKNLCYNT